MLPDHCHRRIDVATDADIVAARGIASALSAGTLEAAEAGRFDALVAALGGHLSGRLGGGTLLLRRWGRREGMECLAYDRDAAGDMVESDSLRTVRARADRFAVHRTPGIGTAMLARVLRPGCSDDPVPGTVAMVGAVMVAKPDAERCGDGWFFRASGPSSKDAPSGVALVVDGVADNDGAAERARRIEAVVGATAAGLSPQMVIGAIRRDFDMMVDATAAVLRIDGRAVDYTALGTVAGAVVRRTDITSLAARWAMVGYNPVVPACVHLLWKPGDHVVLHSDGCARLPVLFIERDLHEVDPTLAAVVLLRDGTAWDDDQTIVVLRNTSNPGTDADGF